MNIRWSQQSLIALKNMTASTSKKKEKIPKRLHIVSENNENAVDKIKSSRFLREDQVKEEIRQIPEDPQKTKSKILRGHRSFINGKRANAYN